MTKEEIIKIFEENHIAKGNATINATKLAEIFTNHEADLLKEFVEWYKQMLIKDHDDKAWMMNHTEEQEVEDRYYYRGQCNAIQRLITLLDSDLKKFLEDRNEL